jgi:hypothetical protein
MTEFFLAAGSALWLGLERDGATGLQLYGATLRVGAAMRVGRDGAPMQRLNQPTGELVARMPESLVQQPPRRAISAARC